jgi:hypothetical protein
MNRRNATIGRDTSADEVTDVETNNGIRGVALPTPTGGFLTWLA